MRNFDEICEKYKSNLVNDPIEDGAVFEFEIDGKTMWVVASFGGGWDHVSVTLSVPRCPKWSEMCMVKDMFFEPEESVMQLHPPKSQYVNNHPWCLHLWRPQNGFGTIPLPDKSFV